MREKNNNPADAGYFLRTEIDSTDFKDENPTTEIMQENLFFKKKKFSKDLETDETIEENKK